jgi:type II secretory pathway predicted ATPase ExeA
MYEAHWGLKEKPFENTSDYRFIYYSSQHQEAFSRMLYVVRERKAAALLTGEYGSGKTLLSRVLLEELKKENQYQSVFIFNPRLSSLEFIKEIVYQLEDGKESSLNRIDLFHTLHKILLSNYDAGRHSVIIIDEAQAIIDQGIFEELRLLLNFQLNNVFLLTIILVGQPELNQRVINLPQLKQRIAVRFHLRALSEEETRQYIQHRLKVAEAKQAIFEEEAYREIYLNSFGIPRQINNLCDLALLAGFGSGLNRINKEIIVRVSDDLEELVPHPEQNLEDAREI